MCGKCVAMERGYVGGKGPPRPNPDAMRIRQERIAAMQRENEAETGSVEIEFESIERNETDAASVPSSSSLASFPSEDQLDENAIYCSFIPAEHIPNFFHVPRHPYNRATRLHSTTAPASAKDEFNAHSPEVQFIALEKCEHCSRTFVKEKMHVHSRRCVAEKPYFGDVVPLQRRERKLRDHGVLNADKQNVHEFENTLQDSDKFSAPKSDPVALLESFYRKREEQRVR